MRCKNTVDAHARVPFSAQAEKNDSDYMDFRHTVLGFSARAELRPGLNPSPCNRQFCFQRICFRSRSEISARDEIRHVIGPLIMSTLSPKSFQSSTV